MTFDPVISDTPPEEGIKMNSIATYLINGESPDRVQEMFTVMNETAKVLREMSRLKYVYTGPVLTGGIPDLGHVGEKTAAK